MPEEWQTSPANIHVEMVSQGADKEGSDPTAPPPQYTKQEAALGQRGGLEGFEAKGSSQLLVRGIDVGQSEGAAGVGVPSAQHPAEEASASGEAGSSDEGSDGAVGEVLGTRWAGQRGAPGLARFGEAPQ